MLFIQPLGLWYMPISNLEIALFSYLFGKSFFILLDLPQDPIQISSSSLRKLVLTLHITKEINLIYLTLTQYIIFSTSYLVFL